MWKKTNHSYEIITVEEFLDELWRFKNGLIIKPSTGGGGNGISKVEANNGEITFSGDCKGEKEFLKLINSGNDFVITEVVKQTGILAEIYPHSTNSLRLLVMRNPGTGKLFIARVVQRVGTDKSGFVDNWSAGGISIDVDIETGVMGKGASFSQYSPLDWRRSHPDTNIEFYGVQIPAWKDIVNEVIQISERYFFLSYIGWDVVPMKEGMYILEGNTNSDVNLLQIHRGLLNDPHIKDFYRYYKVIK